jgi:galactosamine-6-phosphate isomerase
MKRNFFSNSGLNVEIAETYGELSQSAANIVTGELQRRPNLLFCASAGGTPTGLYQCLAAKHNHQPKLFSQMRVLQIDEWGGLPAGHPGTCESDLHTKLIKPLRITANRFTGFKTDAATPESECVRVSTWMKTNGPIDICILGLGSNGHIAMNEPAEALAPFVHVARLAKSSQQHGMLTDLKDKPKYGFSLGMADILASRKILLLVSGAHKKAVLKQLLKAEVNPALPASFLWLHPNTVVMCDREAHGTNGRLYKDK